MKPGPNRVMPTPGRRVVCVLAAWLAIVGPVCLAGDVPTPPPPADVKPAPVEAPTTAPAVAESASTKPATKPAATEPAASGEDAPIFGMPPYHTEHFSIYCDKSQEMINDFAVRLEAMHAEYSTLMAKYLRPNNKRFKVFLFSDSQRFVAAGGHPLMPGISMRTGRWPGSRLMLMVHSDRVEVPVDHLMRHEVWHHFNSTNVTGRFPTWLEEGFAEYIGYGIWTGDGVIYGTIRPEAYHSIKGYADAGRIIPLRKLMPTSGGQWLGTAGTDEGWRGYMQSWSLVEFLTTAEEGKYRPRLQAYMDDLCSGRRPTASAAAIREMDPQYQKWVKAITPTLTHEKFYEAVVAILTSHLARAHARGQRFKSAEAFLAAARGRTLDLAPVGDDQWLPPSLMVECFWYIRQIRSSYGDMKLTLTYRDDRPTLRLKGDYVDLELTGAFRLKDGKVAAINVKHLKPVPFDLNAGKKRRLRRDATTKPARRRRAR